MKALIRTGSVALSLLIALASPALFVHNVWVHWAAGTFVPNAAQLQTAVMLAFLRPQSNAHLRTYHSRVGGPSQPLTLVLPPGQRNEGQ